MKTIVSIILVISFFSCQQKKEKDIQSIEVLYYNAVFETPMSINCDEIVSRNDKLGITDDYPPQMIVIDTIITDKNVLQQIMIELNKIEKSNKDYIDTRMKCKIFYANGKTDSLCIDDIPIYGYYNGNPVKFTNKFVYLIRKNCGFYRWIGISEMPYFEELNDTSFAREKVKSIWGEEY